MRYAIDQRSPYANALWRFGAAGAVTSFSVTIEFAYLVTGH
ncbi:hypothetical protein [Moorena sp. SIO3I6]|nr:hypothetical protein [Moorena sp. SIO3I6]